MDGVELFDKIACAFEDAGTPLVIDKWLKLDENEQEMWNTLAKQITKEITEDAFNSILALQKSK